MRAYNKFVLIGNTIMTVIFMVPIVILGVNIAKSNFDFEDIKYSLAASIIGIIYINIMVFLKII